MVANILVLSYQNITSVQVAQGEREGCYEVRNLSKVLDGDITTRILRKQT